MKNMTQYRSSDITKLIVGLVLVAALAFFVSFAAKTSLAEEGGTDQSTQQVVEPPVVEEPSVNGVITGDAPVAGVDGVITGDAPAPIEQEVLPESDDAPTTGPTVVQEVAPVPAPKITSDKADYAPTDTVTIFGHFFQALQNVVLRIVGGVGDTYREFVQAITIDENGTFTALQPLDGIFRPDYNATVEDLDGNVLAETSFTDSIGYNKGVYRTDQAKWTTGNAGGGYQEDQWAYYQYQITDINSTNIPSFNVVFNHHQASSNAIFIDAFANFRACLDNCSGSGGTVGGLLPDGTAFPPAADTAVNQWPVFVPQNINEKYVGGVCGGSDVVNIPSDDHCFRVTGASLAAAVGLPNTGSHTVTLYYAAHLAPTFVWSAGNESLLGCSSSINYAQPGPEAVPSTPYGTGSYNGGNPCVKGDNVNDWTTAFPGIGSATGSSRNFKLQDQTAGSNGAVTLPIPAVPLPTGSITIVKVTNPSPASGVSFSFSGDLGAFNLDTDAVTATPNTVTFSNLPQGTYAVTEGAEPSGWGFTSLACSPTQTVNNATATISISANVTSVTCTYTNSILKVTPTVATDIHDTNHNVVTSVPAGSTVHDKASVTGSNGTATGTVDFTWFANGTCTGQGVASGTGIALVSGVAHPSSSQGPLAAGSYSFKAHYNGDANYFAADGPCEPLTVTKINSSTVTEIHNTSHSVITSANAGTTVHDQATVSGAFGTPTGTVDFTFYTASSQCTGASVASGTGIALVSGVAHPSSSQGPLAAGSYSFKAHYNGDVNNNPADGPCEPLTVGKADTQTTTQIHKGTDHSTDVQGQTLPLGSSVHDSSSVTGQVNGVPLTGNVKYAQFNNGNCSGNSVDETVAVGTESSALNNLPAGDYSFLVTYLGDSNYNQSTATCEVVHIGKADTTLVTEIHNNADHAIVTSVPLGSTVHDKAILSGKVGSITPTGNVTFTWFTNGNCSEQGSAAGSVSVDSNGVAHPSDSKGPLAAGSYSFKAHYVGDANYNSSDADCEPLTVNKAQLAIATTIHDAGHGVIANNGHVALGTNTHDNADVTGEVAGFAIPTISFTFNGNPIANGSTDAGFDATSVASGALGAGNYTYNATVASNDNYIGATSDPEPFVVDKAQLIVNTTIHDANHDTVANNSHLALGAVVHDTAQVTGQVVGFTPTGAVSFTFDKSPNACGTTAIDTSVSLDNGDKRSVATLALGAGDYNFQASIAGDENYIGDTSDCEPFTVDKAQLAITTTVHDGSDVVIPDNGHVALGTHTHDNATVSGEVAGFAIPGISFTFNTNPIANAVSPEGSFDATTVDTGALGAGNYVFNATVASNDNYIGATSVDEPFVVDKAKLSITTEVHDSLHNDITNKSIAVGSTAHDNAEVTGAVSGFPIPAISFTLNGGAIANAVSPEGSFEATTVNTSALNAGNYVFKATVASDNNYDGAISADEPFSVVRAKISIGPTSATNEVGNAHTFVVNVMVDDGSGYVNKQDAVVNAIASPVPTSLNVSDCNAGTDASGNCDIVINSNSAGVFTVTARSTVVVGDVTFKLQTNGVDDNSGPAQKTFVDAKIVLSPLTATNNITDPHTITATVSQNPGNGFVAAPDGTLVTFSLLNNTAGADFIPTSGSNTCTTTAGSCSVQINSSTPGGVDIHATTTFSVGGVSLTRASDSTHGSTGDAHKDYVAGFLDITKSLDVSGYPVAGFPNVDQTFTFHVEGPSYPGPAGHDETFTVTDGVLQSPATIHLGPLKPGSYTVTENSPGVGWDVTGGGSVTVLANQTATKTITNKVKVPHTTISISSNTQETQPGENVILTIIDTNDGQVPLANPTVTLTYGVNNETLSNVPSAHCTAATESGTINGIMDVGEAWTWTCMIMISSDTTFNVDGHGLDPFGTDVSPENGIASEHGSITVTVVNTTRTIGFWQTHTSFTSTVFNLPSMQKYVGFIGPVTPNSHKGTITNGTPSQLFGGFYAPIAKTTTGAKRSAIDQARVQMLQQLLAAKLNCAAFGCSAATMQLIADSDAAYMAGANKSTIITFAGQLDAYNNSGDNGAIPPSLPATGKATPKTSQSLADTAFWNQP